MAGQYEGMITLLPVPHVIRDDTENYNMVLKGQTELEYKVVSVTTESPTKVSTTRLVMTAVT